MNPTKRMIVNTAAQYVKSLINIVLSLYATRIVLEALSISDYGIFAVVAGVVSMLGFITNALIITTQRYISFHHGNGDVAYVGKLFSNSLLLHILLGFGLAVILLAIGPWLIDSVLTIEASRVDTAKWVYVIAVFMLLVSIITSPFKALFIARENIVYISIVEVCDGVLKLIMALSLLSLSVDKLLVYAVMMAVILVFNLIALVVYAKLRYDECRLMIRRSYVDKQCIISLMGFAGWTTYGMGVVAARNQGIAIILNHFMGTVVNAAYGIAFQVYGAIAFVSTSIFNAMNPQIMKAEGSGDRQRMLMLAERESKYSSALIAFACIPLIVEMPNVLSLWLKEVPQDATLFCRCILIAFFFDQLTYGLHTANQATGRIRNYSLMIYTPKLLTVPAVWLLLNAGYGVECVMLLYVVVELAVALVRLPIIKFTQGLSIIHFLRVVVVALLPLIITQCALAWLMNVYLSDVHFIIRIILLWIAGSAAFWRLSLDAEERGVLALFITKKKEQEK